MTQTLIKPQGMDPTTRLKSKVIISTRDMTAATADVAYTGAGFTPTAIIAYATIGLSYPVSIGMVDSSKTDSNIFQYGTNTYYSTASFLDVATGSGVEQIAFVKTFDSDGFTLTWTKSGSPTGTVMLMFMCFA